MASTNFEVCVRKDDFKFHAAHFVAFKGYRERLHGHNYKVGVRVLGSRKISSDGYVVDFGNIKAATRKICKELNEHFLCPTLSDAMTITTSTIEGQETVKLECEDGSAFSFPRRDCAMLPIVHATTEELAVYLWSRILENLNGEYLLERGVHTMEIIVEEAVGQEATFRLEIPRELGSSLSLDVKSFILQGDIVPSPCESSPKKLAETSNRSCGAECKNCQQEFSRKLQVLADAINGNKFGTSPAIVSIDDLETVIKESFK